MDTNEYLAKATAFNKDNTHPEFLAFTTVWIKSRQPTLYNELLSQFKNIEGEIYAQYESDAKNSELPF